jgi:uncharacterized protein YjdB
MSIFQWTIAAFITVLLAGCGGGGGGAATLLSITVAASKSTLVEGVSQQYTATGNYDNGTSSDISASVTWSSSDSLLATVSTSGLTTGVSAGAVTISATSGDIEGTAGLTINAATLQSITVTASSSSLVEGLSQQYTATGNYDNGTSADITPSVTWSSSDITLATVNTSGLATGLFAGGVTIKAASGATEGTAALLVNAATLQSITVTASSPSLVEGLTQQYMATGNYDNGTSVDITSSVTWSSSDDLLAIVNTSGLATGLIAGAVRIKAASGATEGTAALLVNAATLQSITVTASNPNLVEGLTQQYTATAHYDNGSTADITSSVTWSSSDIPLATVNTSGLATAIAAGAVTIKAASGAIEGTAALTVNAATLQSITVTAPSPSLVEGLAQQYKATGNYNNGSTAEITSSVTWSSSDITLATVNTSGLATAISAGAVTIKAVSGAIEGTAALTVNAATLIDITIEPADPTIGVGLTQSLTATGNYNNGSTSDLTSSVIWSSNDIALATVNGSGLATGIAEGSTTISATSGVVVGLTTLTTAYFTEGATTPVAVAVGNPYTGIVDTTSSYYETVVSAGNAYTVSFTGMTDDVDLFVYNSNGDLLCGSENSGIVDDSCSIMAQENTILIRAYGAFVSGNGATYTVTVSANTTGYIVEGKAVSTTVYVGTAHSGMVDTTSSYYYASVNANAAYTISLTNLTDDADLYVQNSNGDFLCGSENAGATDDSCSVVAQEGSIRIVVSGAYALGGGTTYSLNVNASGGYVAEGAVTYTTVYLGTAHFGNVDRTISWYQVAVSPSTPYTFSLAGLTDDADLLVYDSNGNNVCLSALPGTMSESCSASSPGTTMYIAVDGTNVVGGAAYSLTVN